MDESNFWRIRKNYEQSLKKLRKKSEKGEKIRVGYSVIFDSAFPMEPVFEEMLEDDFFEPFLIVIPDISRGDRHAIEAYSHTCGQLAASYGGRAPIIKAINWKKRIFSEVTDICDLYCPANPYDSLTKPQYGIRNFCEHGIPVFFANYGIAISSFYDNYMKGSEAFSFLWRIFSEVEHVNDLFSHHLPWVDSVYSGYPKMDKLASFIPKARERKKIIIAPHHTIADWKGGVNFGTFLNYQDFFLELPILYPNIDFVFRPHPLLFTALARNDSFGGQRAEEYLRKMKSHPNLEVQEGGDYLETFVNSDALIHDCGSFTAEYLYLDKPACRLLRNEMDLGREYNPFALECIACHDLAYVKEDIINFINNVVLKGNDSKAGLRQAMSAKLKKNFPHVSRSIVKNIRAAIENA